MFSAASMRSAAFTALACAFLTLAWQFLTVRYNYHGDWSALFCTGALRGTPEALASEHIYQFPGSGGYDGQMYHYVAHDPLLRDRRFFSYLDEPRLRYRRILVPALAFALAGGASAWVDRAYDAVILLFVWLGVFWTSGWFRDRGRSPVWGVVFLALPAVLVSVDRMVTDVALVALAAGLARWWRAMSWRPFVMLICATLVRETGFLLLAGYCGWLLVARRFRRAALFSLAAAPAAAWYGYVGLRTRACDYRASFVPLSAAWNAFLHPLVYPPSTRMIRLAETGDFLALCGTAIAFALSTRWLIARKLNALTLAGLCFTAVGILLQRPDPWHQVYDFGRVYSPLLLFLVLDGLEAKSWASLLPLALIDFRVLVQFGNQILGVVAGLLRG